MQDKAERTIVITGGAGFIGSNLTERLLGEERTRVRIFDNFSRRGVEHNLAWLRSLPSARKLEVVEGDVRDEAAVNEAIEGASEVYHLAAQVAVTTSIDHPWADFEVNARGTLHVLEAARRSDRQPLVLFTSTNKVYGALEKVPVELNGTHYRPTRTNCRGVSEHEPLDFHSPYGCSKGAADQYVRDYARVYDLPTIVFRMSCIAGPRQFGNEDQGWVAHFLYSVLQGQPITIYGDGYQVRDVLHVYDLVDAMMAARCNLARTRGEVYNLGGGVERAFSVLEMLRRIEQRTGQPLKLTHETVRPGDQPWYVADTKKLEQHTGWRPRRSLEETLGAIHGFWKEHRLRSAGSLEMKPQLLNEEVA